MSFTINSVVFKIFLPIIVGLAIFGTLDSIKVNSLDGNVDNLNDAINSFDRTVTFGVEEGNTDRARAKLREVLIFNILAANHCGLVSKPDEAEIFQNQEKVLESEKLLDGNNLNEDYKGAVVFPIPGNSPYELLREDDNLMSCAGADPISQSFPGISSLKQNQGQDMEGKFGRIDFSVSDNFTLRDPRVASLFFTDLPEGAQIELLSNKMIYFAPGECYDARSSFYEKNVRMENVPVIFEGDLTNKLDWCNENIFDHDNREQLRYLICDGSSGYIQTNVGRISQDGESNMGIIEGAIWKIPLYPKMTITQGSNDCIEDEKIVNDQTSILANEVDINEDGKRESCKFNGIEDYGSVSAEWQNMELECSLKKLSSDRNDFGFNTVWKIKENQKCDISRPEISEQVPKYDITNEFAVKDESNGKISIEKSIRFSGSERSDPSFSRLEYILNYFEEIEKIEIKPVENYDSYTRYSIETSENEYIIKEEIAGPVNNRGPDYYVKVGREGDGDLDIIHSRDDKRFSNKIEFNAEKNKIIYYNSEQFSNNVETYSKNMEIDGEEIEKLNVAARAPKNPEKSELIIDSIEVTGEIANCNYE